MEGEKSDFQIQILDRNFIFESCLDIHYGCPKPQYLRDEESGEEFFYTFEKIHKHLITVNKIVDGKTIKEKELDVPRQCFDAKYGKVEQIFIESKDKIIIESFFSSLNIDTLFIWNPKTNQLNEIVSSSFFQDSLVVNNFNYFSVDMYEDPYLVSRLGFSYDERDVKEALGFEYPNYLVYDTKERAARLIFSLPEEFRKRIRASQPYSFHTMNKEKLLIIFQYLNLIFEVDIKSNSYEEHLINNKNFTYRSKRKNENTLQYAFESDYYSSFVYHKKLDIYIITQHIGEDYLMEDGLRSRDFSSSNNRMIILNKNFEIIGSKILTDSVFIGNFRIQQTDEGFFVRKGLEQGKKILYQEYKINL